MTTNAYSQGLIGSEVRGVEHHTASDTLKAGETGTVHTNKGAAGAIVLTLPAAVVGLNYYFAVRAAQTLTIEPNGTDTISLPSSGVPEAAGDYIVADAIGETVFLMCVEAGSWACFGVTGTWTGQ